MSDGEQSPFLENVIKLGAGAVIAVLSEDETLRRRFLSGWRRCYEGPWGISALGSLSYDPTADRHVFSYVVWLGAEQLSTVRLVSRSPFPRGRVLNLLRESLEQASREWKAPVSFIGLDSPERMREVYSHALASAHEAHQEQQHDLRRWKLEHFSRATLATGFACGAGGLADVRLWNADMVLELEDHGYRIRKAREGDLSHMVYGYPPQIAYEIG